MPTSCVAVDCTRRALKGSRISFFRLPKDGYRRILWLKAIRRKNWIPNKQDRICSLHFVSGKPASLEDTNSPDWVPSINLGYGNSSNNTRQRNKKLASVLYPQTPGSSANEPFYNSQHFLCAPTIVVLNQENLEQDHSLLPRIENVTSCSEVKNEGTLERSAEEISTDKYSTNHMIVEPDISSYLSDGNSVQIKSENDIDPSLPIGHGEEKKEVSTMTDLSIMDIAKMEKDLEDLKQKTLEMALRMSKQWP